MRKLYTTLFLVFGLMFAINTYAQDELLWDYTETAPSANPDNGLTYASKVNDAAGTKNGLKGIKMNSSGYCYFTKNAVAGTLKLTFGPRDGANASSLDVYTYASTPGKETLVATTPDVTECQTVSIELTAEQNNIYICRHAAVEQVLCKIQFTTGGSGPQAVTVTYKDQRGNIIGKVDATEGDALGTIPYSQDDLTIGEDSVFRGWVYVSGTKAKSTDTLKGNTTITALVTARESATVGSVQNYNFASSIFYPEDHETITTGDGYFHDSTHGWAFATGGTVSVNVAGNAQIVLSLCKYSKKGAITVTDAAGNTVATIDSAYVATDGATACINYKGEATTLTFTFTEGESYIHKMLVFNVKDFVEKDAASGYYIVPANDGAAFLAALNSANNETGARIFLPNGTYDLGETTGTTISADNMTIVGQGDVTIVNAPDVKNEGLGSADLLLNTSTGLYVSNLTLKNALDYYGAGSAGRAAAFHDKGNRTICTYVNLDSHQDTYYSNKDGAYCYFFGGTIYGTVDYICGGGNIFFDDVTLHNYSRSATGNTGDCTITAPYTAATDKGYVFEGAHIVSDCATFNFGRSWKDGKCAYLNSFILSGKLASSRWTLAGMNSAATAFKEYGTADWSGNGFNTPESYVATFTHKDGDKTYETVLTTDQADELSYDSYFADANWNPAAVCADAEARIASVNSKKLTMADEGTYLVTTSTPEKGDFITIFTGKEFDYDFDMKGTYSVRMANARGDFGTIVKFGAESETPIADGVKSINPQPSTINQNIYNIAGQRITSTRNGVNIVDGKKVMISK